jgi:carboxypeptidase family protein
VIDRRQWITILCAAALAASIGEALGLAQETAPPASSPAPRSPAPETTPAKPGKQKYSHVNDFLIRGTVFSDQARSFPGVQLRIRKAGEKKFRWESYTNSRGEFAMRVPQGSDYEIVVRAKGFLEQIRPIDAKTGAHEQSIVFRMEPAAGGKG